MPRIFLSFIWEQVSCFFAADKVQIQSKNFVTCMSQESNLVANANTKVMYLQSMEINYKKKTNEN